MTLHDIRRIGGRIGAEVVGIDLNTALAPAVAAELSAALVEHKVLAFRGQALADAAHTRFAGYFGELTTAHPTVPSIEDNDHILAVEGGEGARANRWHTDVTFLVTPPKATTLRSLVVPPYSGDTLVANTQAAYRDLPGPLRDLADRLRAVHTNDHDYAEHPQFRSEEATERHKVFVSRRYSTAHPVVRVHPESGEPGLFIGGFAQRIVGLSPTESRDILRLLQSYVTRPENTFRWHWAPGDVIIFDNRATQHYAPDDYGDLPRKLHRATVAGDVPVGLDGEPSYAIEGDDASHYTKLAS